MVLDQPGAVGFSRPIDDADPYYCVDHRSMFADASWSRCRRASAGRECVREGTATARQCGQVPTLLTQNQLEYTSELLYLIAIMVWKATNGMSSAQIFGLADERRRRKSTIIATSIAVMFLAAFFACVFQCQGPDFWAIRSQSEDRCFNRVGGALDIDELLLTRYESLHSGYQ